MSEQETFEERFIRFLPDLEAVVGLDLNRNHFLTVEDAGTTPNLGIGGLYSVGNSGHDFLVHCILPGVCPDHYPIAVFSEEEGVAQVISASITTWFPSFLVHRVNELLCHYWLCQRGGSLKSAALTLESLSSIVENRALIGQICREFNSEAFLAKLDEVFAAIQARDVSAWTYEAFYRAAEAESSIGRFFDLKQRDASDAAYVELVRSCPEYNFPLFDRCLSGNHTLRSRRTVDVHKAKLPPDLAIEVFSRRLSIDFGNTSDIARVVTIAARSCVGAIGEASPYFEMVREVQEHQGNYVDLLLAEASLDLGKRLEQQDLLREAATAFENAVFFTSVEREEFNAVAFGRLCEVAERLGDDEYEAYLAAYGESISV